MDNIKIHFLNTIWSDCILVEVNNHYGLIDSATDYYYKDVKDYLDSNNIKTLDFIILTHFHCDHYGNINRLLDDYKVNKVYFRDYSGHEDYLLNNSRIDYENNQYDIAKSIKEKAKAKSNLAIIDSNLNEIYLDNLKLEIYNNGDNINNIYNDKNSEFYHQECLDENFNSIGIFLMVNNHSVFLAGDMVERNYNDPKMDKITSSCIKRIYSKHNIDHIELLKVPHHGEKSCNPESLYEVIKPTNAIITNTNRWLDNFQTIDKILKANPKANVLKTDYYQYIFDLSNTTLSYKIVEKDSLFITLNKD